MYNSVSFGGVWVWFFHSFLLQFGCCEALCLLSAAFPVCTWSLGWHCGYVHSSVCQSATHPGQAQLQGLSSTPPPFPFLPFSPLLSPPFPFMLGLFAFFWKIYLGSLVSAMWDVWNWWRNCWGHWNNCDSYECQVLVSIFRGLRVSSVGSLRNFHMQVQTFSLVWFFLKLFINESPVASRILMSCECALGNSVLLLCSLTK